MSIRHVARATPAALGLLLAVCGCASDYGSTSTTSRSLAPVEIINEITATAEVTSIDATTRLVTLRREDGNLFQIVAGPEVRNFDQISTGDRLKVHFKESIKASLRPPGEGGPDSGASVVATRAPQGGTPAASIGMGASVRVKIESIDIDRDIVVFSLPSGELITHRIATPEGRKFVKGLHIGDKVQLDYAKALALSIEKA